jgi:hypothetical protein
MRRNVRSAAAQGDVRRTPVDDGLALSSSRGRIALVATVAGSGMASLDATVVNVALPRVEMTDVARIRQHLDRLQRGREIEPPGLSL